VGGRKGRLVVREWVDVSGRADPKEKGRAQGWRTRA